MDFCRQRLRCVDPAAEVRRDRPLPLENQALPFQPSFVVPLGKVSRASTERNELTLGEAPKTHVSKVGSAARAVDLYSGTGSAQPAAVFGRETFAAPVFHEFSVSCRRLHYSLAQPPTP